MATRPTVNGTANANNTGTVSINLAASVNKLIVYGLYLYPSSPGPGAGTATYNSVSMTRLGGVDIASGSRTLVIEVFELDDPDTGTAYNAVHTPAGTPTDQAVIAIGVDDAGAIGSTSPASADNGDATNATVTFSTDDVDGLILAAACRRSGDTPPLWTPGSGSTELIDDATGTNPNFDFIYTALSESASGGSDTINSTVGSSDNIGILAIEIEAVPEGTKTVSETGGGTDAIASLAASLSLAETGGGADAVSVDKPSNFPQYVGQAAASQDSGTSITLNKPTGTAEDDLMLVFLAHASGSDAGFADETGWTKNTINNSEVNGAIYYKIAGASEPSSFTFDFTDNNNVHGLIIAVTNVNTSNPVNVQSYTNGASGTEFTEAITTTEADTLLYFFIGADQASAQTVTWSDSMTERYDQCLTSTFLLVAAAEQEAATAQEYSRTITKTGGNSQPNLWFLAIEGATGATVKTVAETGGGTDAIASLAASLSLAETGGGSDTLPGTAVDFSLGDTGAGADLATLAQILLNLAEAGAGTDAIANLAAALSLAEAGAGADAVGLALKELLAAETGSGTDAIAALAASLSLAEAGAGADALAALAAALSQAETGSGTDAIANLAAALSQAETGSGTDAIANLAAALSLADTGTGAEAPAIQAAITVSGTGGGLDTVNILTATLKTVADTAAGNDAITAVSVSLAAVDTGTGGDSLTINVSLSLADTAAGADVVNVLTETLKTVADTAAGTDDLAVSVSLSLADTGTGAEAIPIFVSFALADTGAGVEAVNIISETLITAIDAGGGLDAIAALAASLSLADTGTGAEAPAIGASLSLADTGTGAEALAAAVSLAIAEAGAGTDSLAGLTVYVNLADTAAAADLVANVAAALALSDTGAGIDLVTRITAGGVAILTFTFNRRLLSFDGFVSRALTFSGFVSRRLAIEFDPGNIIY